MWFALIVLLAGIIVIALSFVMFPTAATPGAPRSTGQLAGVIVGSIIALVGLIMVLARIGGAGVAP